MAIDIITLKKRIQLVGRDTDDNMHLVTVGVRTILRSVVSVSEAAQCWQRDRDYIQQLARNGTLAAEKMGGQWMIITQDLVDRWGEPKIKLEDLRDVE